MKIREAMAEVIYKARDKYDGGDYVWGLSELTDEILALKIDGCRLAIVKEQGELPENPYLWREATIYQRGQQGMLKAHYVQEEVNG